MRMHAFGVEAYSSGSRPSGKVNERAIQFMAERDYDLTSHDSKGLDAIPDIEYDYAITMGCGDECPLVNAKHREDWSIDDPKNMIDADFRRVRDDIERRVMDLIGRL